MDIRLLIVAYLMICILPVMSTPYRSRSRNKNSSPTYDQKQTGEYNIQLHLKDFEVVALLSDSSFGEGDYDYNYDYSELTQKPSTSKPLTTSKTQKPDSSTVQTTIQTTESVLPTQLSTLQPTLTTKIPTDVSTSKSSASQGSSTLPTVRLENELENNVTKEENNKATTLKTEILIKPVENLTIINDKEQNFEEHLPLVVHRKCASGFTRDKMGRCRRVRRPAPQFSFGISRLANLASKLRQGPNESQSNETASIEE